MGEGSSYIITDESMTSLILQIVRQSFRAKWLKCAKKAAKNKKLFKINSKP